MHTKSAFVEESQGCKYHHQSKGHTDVQCWNHLRSPSWLNLPCLFPSAGLKSHDVITSINGQPVHNTDDVSDAVQSGQPLSVVVHRENRDVILTVVPEEVE